MKVITVLAVLAVVAAEAVLVAAGRGDIARYAGAVLAGAALVAMLVAVLLDEEDETSSDEQAGQVAAAATLAEWRHRAELSVEWARGTRTDWDRHVRPMLSREFAAATGKSPDRDYAAWTQAGADVFGPELWQWVDARQSPHDERSPGTPALVEICSRLEAL